MYLRVDQVIDMAAGVLHARNIIQHVERDCLQKDVQNESGGVHIQRIPSSIHDAARWFVMTWNGLHMLQTFATVCTNEVYLQMLNLLQPLQKHIACGTYVP